MGHCTEEEFYDCIDSNGMFRVTGMFEGRIEDFENCFFDAGYIEVVEFANEWYSTVEIV